MSGISGILDRKQKNLDKQAIINNMLKAMRHRGPDNKGFFSDANMALGFVRLSVLDHVGGMQPVYNEDKSVVVICDGAIYNYKELRVELQSKNHIFHTQSDIEVLPHLYEEEGPEFIKRLEGQFAVALYDQREQLLYLGRDQVGMGTLYYAEQEDSFIFASEIKAILEYPGIRREIDLTALDQVLTFPGFLSPRTIFKNISGLESGHYLIVKDGKIMNREYWDLDYSATDSKSEDQYIEELQAELVKAVKNRINTDVPTGFYISGGLDSSLVARLIHMVGRDTVRHSFSIDFMQRGMSEKKYQKLMQEQVGSIHNERLFGIEDIVSNIKDVIYYSECPLKETYNTASYVLSGMVKENGIKVVLSGEGADELFAGYVGYKFDQIRNGMRQQGISQISPEDMEMNQRLWGDPYYTYEKNHSSFNQEKKLIYSPKLVENFDIFDCTKKSPVNLQKLSQMDLVQKRSYLDFKVRLADHLLTDHGDHMSYANSVEGRFPFLDINIIKIAEKMPSALKLNNLNEKYILKQMGKELLPKEILKRAKFSFVAPGSSEMLKSENEYINDIISYETIKKQGIFDADYIEKLRNQYKRPEFKLNLPFDNDMMIIVITTGILMDIFKLKNL